MIFTCLHEMALATVQYQGGGSLWKIESQSAHRALLIVVMRIEHL